MKDTYFKLIKNERIAANTFLSVLEGDTSDITAPGQFVNIKLDGFYLRRPISVCNVEGDQLTIIYKAVGAGTEKMSCTKEGENWLVLTGLGNGYDLSKSGDKPLLVGGGAGVPPMYYLARKLVNEGKTPTVILGFGKADEVFFKDEFEALGLKVLVTTVDGSFGIKGFVTDAIRESGVEYDYFYSCGPLPMLKALCSATTTSGEVSLEERMGCGFGICMGCSIMTANGAKRVCKDGPVFKKEEVIW